MNTVSARALGTVSARALGTTVSITGTGSARALAELERLERVLTRFGESPLTRLNQQGWLEQAPAELIEGIKHALWVADWTDGLVTPTVLPALERAGYRDSWVPGSGTRHPVPGRDAGRLTLEKPSLIDWRGIKVANDLIQLPEGVRIDLGGTAKTWIAERVSHLLEGDFVIDAGGDIVARQSAPFTIQVQPPFGGEALALELPAGRWGVATSSTVTRAWVGGHHLIDPRTGRPLESRFAQITVVADRATMAEVATKLAFLNFPSFERFAEYSKMVLCFEHDGSCHIWNGETWNAFTEES